MWIVSNLASDAKLQEDALKGQASNTSLRVSQDGTDVETIQALIGHSQKWTTQEK